MSQCHIESCVDLFISDFIPNLPSIKTLRKVLPQHTRDPTEKGLHCYLVEKLQKSINCRKAEVGDAFVFTEHTNFIPRKWYKQS